MDILNAGYLVSLKLLFYPPAPREVIAVHFLTCNSSALSISQSQTANRTWEQEVDGSNPFAPIEVKRFSSASPPGFFRWVRIFEGS